MPTILCEIESGSVTRSYVYANAQVLAVHDGDYAASASTVPRYFYMHDRLGSVRMLIDSAAAVTNTYTYNPFGEDITSECSETFTDNPWKYTGQYYDKEISQYYLRARQYDPHIARFTTRDPIKGGFIEPMTLHAYLYCLNDPVNRTDLSGRMSATELGTTGGIKGFLMSSVMKNVYSGSITGALTGAITGGYSEGDGTWSWGNAGSGALRGGIKGGIGGALGSLSAMGWLKMGFETELASWAQGAIAAGGGEFAMSVWENRKDLLSDEAFYNISENVLISTIFGAGGGYAGEMAPPLGGVPSGIAAGEFANLFKMFLFEFIGAPKPWRE